MKCVAAWFVAGAVLVGSRAGAAEPPLVLEMKAGSEVHHGRNATVTVRVKNTTERPVTLYLRRDLITYEVLGPDGETTTCSPVDAERHPGRRGFTTLRPHRSRALTTRLVELCPRWTFSKRGEYLVRAHYEPEYSGRSVGLHAYVGPLDAETPAVVTVEHDARVYRNHVVTPAPPAGPVPPPPAPPKPAPPPRARAVPARR
ncbi:MAG TPA: hypothetical protein VHC69_30395 [Polyangiaceae bacterium]|nr:hypothetical protein [Polyangiaceae bacterium]